MFLGFNLLVKGSTTTEVKKSSMKAPKTHEAEKAKER